MNASKEIGKEVNTDKLMKMFLSRYRNAGKYHNVNMPIDPLKMWLKSKVWGRQ
jgi:hypothetical protein